MLHARELALVEKLERAKQARLLFNNEESQASSES